MTIYSLDILLSRFGTRDELKSRLIISFQTIVKLPLLVRTPILLDSGTTLMLLFNANYSPFPNTATPAARASVYERGGGGNTNI